MNKKLLSSEKIVKTFSFDVKSVKEDEYIVEGVFSTPDPDRHNEVVMQEGWKLKNYLKNPVVLWSHQNMEFPLAQMVRIGYENGNLTGAMKFAVNEYETAATAFKLVKGKYLRAFSVGFMNNVYEVDKESEIVKLVENELLEVSVVNIPAQAAALAKMKRMDFLAPEVPEHSEKEGRVLSSKSRGIIEKAKLSLEEVLAADSEKEPKKAKAKFKYKKILGKAVRELIKARNG